MAATASRLRSYAVACVAVAIVTGLKLALSDVLGRDAPVALLGLAIVGAGAVGGARSAFTASVLAALTGWYFFLPPRYTFLMGDVPTLIRTGALFTEGLVISAFVAKLETARTQAEKSAARLDRLQSLTSALAAAVTPEDVARITVNKGVEALNATTGVFVQARFDGELEVVAHHGVEPHIVSALTAFAPSADYPTALAFRRRQPEWVESADEYARRYPEFSARSGDGLAAAASLPLSIGERTLGAIAFRFDHRRKFSASERALMQTLASQSAQAFERSLLFADEVRTRQRLEKLNALMQALSTALTQSDVAQIIVEHGVQIAGADTCTLYVPDMDGALRLIGDCGVNPTVIERIRRISRDSPNPVAATIRTGETLWAENDADYLALYPALATLKVEGPRARAFWSVPLVAEGQPIGLLGMGFYAPRTFPPEERSFVEMLTRHCAQALRRAERLAAERAARTIAERLQSSLETTLRSIGDAVIATDSRGLVTLMNHVAEQLTGWPEADAQGRRLSDVFRIVNENTRAEVENPAEKVLREGIVVGLANHTLLIHRDGRHEIPIDDSGAPIRAESGQLEGVVLVFRDVSEKKREEARGVLLSAASAALSESLDYRATLTRVAQLAVPELADWCSVDIVPEGSAQSERLAVAHIDPAKIQFAHELTGKYPPDPNAERGLPNVLRSGRSELFPTISDEMLQAAAIDAEHLRLCRELQLHSAMVVPLLARGRVLGAMTFVWAESGRVYSAADLEFAEDLAHRCAIAIDNAQLYAAEQRARQAADSANRTKDEFLAIMGHELRNPLAPMVTAVHLMKMRSAHRDDGKELAVLERQLQHMMRLLEDLLDVSRVLRDKVDLSPQTIEIAEVVANAVDVASPLIDRKQHHLVLDVATSGLAVDVDPVRMAQVFGNLLTNAAKYTDRGGEIRVAAGTYDGVVRVAIEDNGVGIEPDLMPRLFELFSQGKQGIDRQLGGLGIGLAIASRLVQEHGGQLAAYSDGPNRGSRFIVQLPRAAHAAPITLPPPAAAGPAPARKRVLVVDDNEDSGELMSALLEQLGHDSRVAFEGVRALELAAEFAPHIVFLDIGLPGMNGFEIARRMRQLPMCATIPIIALTGYTRDSDREEALRAGFSEHFAKPIAIDRLRAALDQATVTDP
jgi:PAS domain S-box-containing protein